MNFVDLRLKIKHFFRKNKKIIFVIVIVWLFIFFINQVLKLYTPEPEIEDTYEPHVSVIDSSQKVPEKYQTNIEDLIEEYVNYCNNNDFDKAYNMLSKDCKEYAYPTYEDFIDHLKIVMYTPKKYSIQNYSNLDDMYIYSISYTDDFLATGLTNTEYSYTEEKMAFKENEDGQLEMSVGNFIKHENINLSTENEYLKIDVKDRIVNYATEEYTVRFTNRTNYDIVISDYVEENEITLSLSNEVRGAEQHEDIVLGSNETKDVKIVFSKYVDDNDSSNFINFNNIRVLEDYYGEFSENTVIEDKIINAIAKFSMNVAVNR